MNRFSIILPVRNGGSYVKECVQSILSQTLNDFNLIVLDNCSTDGTLGWLQSLKDERIILYPSAVSLTIEENWQRIVTVGKNEFITLIGHDDVLTRDYLATMNQLIECNPDASLYQSQFNYIDGNGSVIKECKRMDEKYTPMSFLHAFLLDKFDMMGTGFMMRSKDYDAIGGIPNYPNLLFADFELFLNLAKLGYMAVSPKTCFAFRIHQSTTTVSADLKFQQAFGQFIGYLEILGKEDEVYKNTISKHGEGFLLFYCKGLVHRLIRKPKKLRPGVSVAGFVQQCKVYANRLMLENTFQPEKVFSIKLAKWIDQFAITRSAFLLYKKIYSKPVL